MPMFWTDEMNPMRDTTPPPKKFNSIGQEVDDEGEVIEAHAGQGQVTDEALEPPRDPDEPDDEDKDEDENDDEEVSARPTLGTKPSYRTPGRPGRR